MSNKMKVDFIHAGAVKSASSWIYTCLSEHPEISVPEDGDFNFFNVKYHKGKEWLNSRFDVTGKITGEVSPGYLHHPHVAERVYETYPDAKLLFCLRNPVERAYSHWWHSYSNKYATFEFEEVFEKYAPHHYWIIPGFYAHHLKKFDRYFDENQIEILLFDDLVENDEEFIRDYYGKIGVNKEFKPSVLNTKDNTADVTGNFTYVRMRNWIRKNAPTEIKNTLKFFWDPVRGVVESRKEYEDGMDDEMRKKVEKVYVDDVRHLSERIDRDLNHWFEFETV